MLILEHVSPATRLLEKRRQMFEVQDVLHQQQAGFARKEELFRRQEAALKKKDLDLQDSLIKFSKFLQENDGKVTRAERKAREEIALRLAKEAEISELEATLEALRSKCASVDAVVEGSMKYQQYLVSVVESDPDVHEVGELLNRHSTLIETNTDLKAQQAANTAAMERVRGEMAAFVKAKTDEVLRLSNRVATLKQQVQAAGLLRAEPATAAAAAGRSTRARRPRTLWVVCSSRRPRRRRANRRP